MISCVRWTIGDLIKISQGYIIYSDNSHFIGFIGDFVFCILFYFYFIEEFQTA